MNLSYWLLTLYSLFLQILTGHSTTDDQCTIENKECTNEFKAANKYGKGRIRPEATKIFLVKAIKLNLPRINLQSIMLFYGK